MSKKLYIGNLPWSVSEDDLKKAFSKFGEIEEAVLITDKFTRRSKGFGFVTFSEEADADKAIAEMNGKDFEGRELTVNEARPMKSDGEKKSEEEKTEE